MSIPCSDLLLSLQSFECLWSFEGICKKRTRHQKIIQRRETLLVNILYKEIYFKMCKNVFSPSHKKKVFKSYPGTETQTLENKAKIDLFSLYAFLPVSGLKGFSSFMFCKLFLHMLVNKAKFEINSSLEYYHMT